MNIVFSIGIATALGSVPWLVQPAPAAQRPESGLVRVTQEEEGGFDARDWRARLEARDLDARERAFDEIVARARRGADARAALQDWARGSGELAWTARLALRELGPRRGGFPGRDAIGGRLDEFERLFEHLDQRFGGLDSMIEDLERRMHDLHGGRPAVPAPGPGATWRSGGSVSLSIQPDGVRVEITEEVDGKSETKTYEAESLEALLDAHPELRGRLGGAGGGFGFGPRAGAAVPDATPLPRVTDGVRTDLLGIHYEDVGEDRAEDLGLAEGVGLRVTGTSPGTIAEVLGLREGDVVVEVNGRELRGAGDVRAALGERRPDEPVRVVLYGSDGERRTLTWKPARRRDS